MFVLNKKDTPTAGKFVYMSYFEEEAKKGTLLFLDYM